MYKGFVRFVQELYQTRDPIPLHTPKFVGNEKEYVLKTIDSTFVSSIGEYVDLFESKITEYTGSKYAIATVNGTAALHMALKLAGVEPNSEVITQSLTFVATCNAIRYCGAKPIFVDVSKNSLGLSVSSLQSFLEEYIEVRDDGYSWNKVSNKKITACLPMHTFGFPVEIDKIKHLCDQYHIPLVEDAAESLGSFYQGKHTGTFGKISSLSFNGNKILTTGGGGIILTNDKILAERAKHLTTTAKISHGFEFNHDEVAYNYRLPNLNAALGVAQMESLQKFIDSKRKLAISYQKWGDKNGIEFFREPHNTKANYWLNVLITKDKKQRDEFIKYTNSMQVMTRPAWTSMHLLSINSDCQSIDLSNTEALYEQIVNVPSSVILK